MGRRDRRGTLREEADGAHATLIFHREYPHQIEAVWEAVATPEGLREWLMCTKVTLEPRVGGAVEMISGAGQYHSTGRVLAWDPPRVLAYEWNVAPMREMPQGERAIFRYELSPTEDGAGARLLVTYARITRTTARGFLPGLHAFLDRLEAQLDGQPLPDWLARFGVLRAQYPEWTEHTDAPSPGK